MLKRGGLLEMIRPPLQPLNHSLLSVTASRLAPFRLVAPFMNAPARSFGMFGTHEKSAAAGWCHAPSMDARMNARAASHYWVAHPPIRCGSLPCHSKGRCRDTAPYPAGTSAGTLGPNPGRDPSLRFHPVAGHLWWVKRAPSWKHHLIPGNLAVNSHV